MKTTMIKSKVLKENIVDFIKKEEIPNSEKFVDLKFVTDNCKVTGKLKTKGTNKIYPYEREIEITDMDILNIAIILLKKDEMKYKEETLKTEIEHIPGDSFEPLDYGHHEFTGVCFDIKES